MKTRFRFLLVGVGILAMTTANAQRRTIEDRVAVVHQKFDSSFHLEATKQATIDSAFATYYRKQDAIRQEARSGGERPDFQAMRVKLQPAMDARDKELQTLLTAEQFRKWKDEIEPGLMPQRPGRRE